VSDSGMVMIVLLSTSQGSERLTIGTGIERTYSLAFSDFFN
jgi:hypothetical protein